MNKKEIPVLLLTGYLGSGKTTLVNRILSNRRGIKFAVIVNDIGEVNIDADLIEKGGIVNEKDDSLVALQNGCICCTLKMDLVKQLHDIVKMRKFDYIVIEASGICEPAPIAQTVCSIPTMGPEYIKDGILRLDCIATVVDALRMRDEFGSGDALVRQEIGEEDIENLVIQQIEFCNIVLLNKAAEVEPRELARIKHIIRALQPKAEIIECNYGDVDLDKLVNTGRFDFDAVATSAAWIDEIEHHHGEETEEAAHHDHHDDHNHEAGHHHHHHEGGEVEEYGIGTFVYYRRKPFDLVGFDEFIATQWPRTVIRCKGICWFKDEPQTCYVFEQAGRQMGLRNAGQWYATMPEKELEALKAREEGLRRDWDETYGDRMQKLVFIGQHLDKDEISRLLDARLVD
ncbi:CobW family GTP-binding protein [Segatella maculosa]|uniref:CobW family GTP-binding protein n=1 Tax=Segatella maculosa TaxID=439703 RepID=UPI00037D982E|nr:GTP-binding protein [Segatella maculosa]